MKKIFVLLAGITFIGMSCIKDEDPVIPFAEQRTADSIAIVNYIIDNNIMNVLQDCNTVISVAGSPCTGYVSYVIHENGNGLSPLLSDNIQVSYEGRLMSTEQEFDANSNIDFNLGGLITGWQAVLLDMQEGDSVTMYIPSGYGYGSSGTSGIPANANLIFDMRLHKINQ